MWVAAKPIMCTKRIGEEVRGRANWTNVAAISPVKDKPVIEVIDGAMKDGMRQTYGSCSVDIVCSRKVDELVPDFLWKDVRWIPAHS